MPSVQTSVSSVELADDGLLHWTYRQDVVLTRREAEEEVRHISELVKAHAQGKTRMLVDIRPVRSIDREAMMLFASERFTRQTRTEALGLVTGSSSSQIMGKFYKILFRPKHAVRLFSSKEEARQWLGTVTT